MRITLWNLATREVVYQSAKGDDWYRALAFAPDMSCLAVCQYGCNRIRFYPIEVTITELENDEEAEADDAKHDEEAGEEGEGPPLSTRRAEPGAEGRRALVSVFIAQRHEGLDRLARAREGRPRIAREPSQPHHEHFHPVAGRRRRWSARNEPLQAVYRAAEALFQVPK